MKFRREVPYLKAQCQRRGIHPPFDDPTADQLIPIIEDRLATHQKHFGRTCDPTSGYYTEWKYVNDDLQSFLTELRAAAGKNSAVSAAPLPKINSAAANSAATNPPKNISSENAGLSGSTVANQQPSAGSLPGFAGSDPGPARSGPASSGSDPLKPTNPVEPSNDDDEKAHHNAPQVEPQTAHDKNSDDGCAIEGELHDDAFEASLDLHSHLSGRSPLDELSFNEQNAILRLLDTYSAWRVVETLARPRPYGLNLKTSKSALNLFRKRFAKAKENAIKALQQSSIDDLMAKANESEDIFQAAVQRCLKTRLLTATSDPNSNLADINTLVLSLTRLRKQALAEQKQANGG